MKNKSSLKFVLILLSYLTINSTAQNVAPATAYQSVNTIAGNLVLIAPEKEKCEIRLNDKLLLRVDAYEPLNEKKVTPYLSVLKHIKQPMAPFDEILVIGSQSGAAHFWGNGLLFLGLKKNGAYQLTHLGTIMANPPEISVTKNALKITIRADAHITEYTNWKMLGGEWIFKNGQLQKIKTIRYRTS